MLIKKNIPTNMFDAPSTDVQYRLRFMGKITEVKTLIKTSRVPILKIDKFSYKRVETWTFENGKYIPASFVKAKEGETGDDQGDRIFSISNNNTRAGDPRSVLRSLRKLEDIINCNLTCDEDIKRSIFVTLTYKYNVRDPKKVYMDFKEFNRLVRQFLDNNQSPRYEYIGALEPQARGAYHLHIIMLFPEVVPSILTKSRINKCWGHGIVDVREIKSGSNLGKYFVAYLTDMEIREVGEAGKLADIKAKDIKHVGDNNLSKAIIKGMRLHLYPAGINIYRLSRGIKRPCVLKNKANGQPLTRQDMLLLTPLHCTMQYDKAFAYETQDGENINEVRYTRYLDDIPDYIRYDVDILNELARQEMLEETEKYRTDEYLYDSESLYEHQNHEMLEEMEKYRTDEYLL